MNKLFFTCVFVLLFANCFGQFTMDFHQEADVKGKIVSVMTSTSFEYNNGRHDTTRLTKRSTVIYNKKKQLLESDNRSYWVNPDFGLDTLPVKTIYIYDVTGNLKESDRYLTTGGLWGKTTYSKNGSTVVALGYFGPRNELSNTDTLKLDFSGRIIERNSYGKGINLILKNYFTYDEAGRFIKEDAYHPDGSLMYSHSCRYNAYGDIIEDNSPSGNGLPHTFKYEKYDKMHNWLRQIECVNNKPYIIRERVIIYY